MRHGMRRFRGAVGVTPAAWRGMHLISRPQAGQHPCIDRIDNWRWRHHTGTPGKALAWRTQSANLASSKTSASWMSR